ncbi:MAG: hypothetical protein Fur0018_05730 [Anaerolineales bacterium]
MVNQPTWIGKKLKDRYEIESLLGQGGMSAVYKAYDPNLKRDVAVKLIHAHLSDDPEFVRRFEDEAAAVARLSHPNIVDVYDFDHDEQAYFMVLEYLRGETLQQRLRRLNEQDQHMPLEDVVKICAQICEAVDYAHQNGVIHRDLKPANVMISPEGKAVLMDFGIVKIVGDQHHTATGTVLGTALYMSPEQVRGSTIDQRSDIYSLGVMLFEMLSGKPPFEAESAMTVMRMHLDAPVPDIHEVAPDVPDGMRTILQRALEKFPDQRYQTAGDMASDLRAVLAAYPTEKTHIPLQATLPPVGVPSGQAPDAFPQPPSPSQPISPAPQPEKKKNRSCLIIGGVAALLLLCLSVVALAALTRLGNRTGKVSLRVQPSTVAAGENFTVNIAIRNPFNAPLQVDSIHIPTQLAQTGEVLEVNPTPIDRRPAPEGVLLRYDIQIPPHAEQVITLHVRATTPGDFVASLGVEFGKGFVETPLRVVIQPQGASGPSPSQAAQPPINQSSPGGLPNDAPLGSVPYEAVVQIIAMVDLNGHTEEGWSGSGTLLTPDGLILTNAHVALSDKYYHVQALKIALTTNQDRPPEARFYAEVMQADEALDIAVLRITTDLDGNPVNSADLHLPYVPLGNSDELNLGDAITILGYPGIGGATITLTRGDVSGFTSESGRGNRAFIKTSATIAGGNSGGLAANASGYLIGIPTQLGYGGEDQYVDCRVLADTNRDGRIDENDNCVPTGGFINALRPVNLARPLIEAAQRGEINIISSENTAPPTQEIPISGQVLYEEHFSGASSWDVFDGENSTVNIADGAYFISVNPDNYYAWGNANQNFDDVIISVSAQPTQPVGDADFGVMCRYQDKDNFYALEVSEDGYYAIWKQESGEYISLVDWTASDLVPSDGSPITIQAICTDNTLKLAVNGHLLAEVQDASFSHGDIGLLAGTWDTGGVEIRFDDVVVYAP